MYHALQNSSQILHIYETSKEYKTSYVNNSKVFKRDTFVFDITILTRNCINGEIYVN